ncbi:unnamed protein product [Timema podura]|uniref:Anoctamin n=1 Tax=Timema podura TaxID=61482 RepID=A0ABN7P8B9_TIMPD|nr:unnamed protein product [Timema podura]
MSENATDSCRKSEYFRDNVRRVDMILVYDEDRDDDDDSMSNTRRIFEGNLKAQGLELEEEPSTDLSSGKFFVKLHARLGALSRHAELQNRKLPFKKQERHVPKIRRFFRRLTRFLDSNLGETDHFFKMTYQESLRHVFLAGDSNTPFNETERISIVWDILSRTNFGMCHKEIGIRSLLSLGIYTAAFPLHHGDYKSYSKESSCSVRKTLYDNWAHPKAFYKQQPYGLIRKYFGEEVTIYFAWMGWYTVMLVPASIAGILCFLYGLYASFDEPQWTPVREICESDKLICPRCQNFTKCGFQKLSDSCNYAILSNIFDNPSTVVFAVFMSFWSTAFLETWKRKEASYAWRWDLLDVDMVEEARAEYGATVTQMVENPITGKSEPRIKETERILRLTLSWVLTASILIVLICFFITLIVYKMVLVEMTYLVDENYYVKSYRSEMVAVVSSLTSLTVMLIAHFVCKDLALFITNLEKPRTESDYQRSLTFKLYAYEFANFYSLPIYVAFFKGRFYTHPGDEGMWSRFLGLGLDQCDPTGCLSEVTIQLAVTIVGKQLFISTLDVVVPKLRCFWLSVTTPDYRSLPRWEEDFLLRPMDPIALVGERLNTAIKYGFVTLYVTAFPLAPVCALINNIAEIRIDAQRLLTQFRRPVPNKVSGLGVWYDILQGITYLSTATNAFIVAFSTQFIPKLVFSIKYKADLQGYVNFTLSSFPLRELSTDKDVLAQGECWYTGLRHPRGLTGILAYLVPDVPWPVRQLMAHERRESVQLRNNKRQSSLDEELGYFDLK